eukprot:1266431-Rhodomonas_salina.1
MVAPYPISLPHTTHHHTRSQYCMSHAVLLRDLSTANRSTAHRIALTAQHIAPYAISVCVRRSLYQEQRGQYRSAHSTIRDVSTAQAGLYQEQRGNPCPCLARGSPRRAARPGPPYAMSVPLAQYHTLYQCRWLSTIRYVSTVS